MAHSLGKACLCALALGSTALAAQDRGSNPSDPVLAMRAVEIDNETKLINMHGLQITQGDLSIVADEGLATGTDFAKSEWKLNGHVRITLASAVVTSDSAVFTFDDKQLSRGELAGQATFEDTRPGGKESARGGANKILYDNAGRTLRLTEGAWFQDERWQAKGCDIVYNLTTRDMASGSSGCADLFQLRVLPKPGKDAGGADPPR